MFLHLFLINSSELINEQINYLRHSIKPRFSSNFFQLLYLGSGLHVSSKSSKNVTIRNIYSCIYEHLYNQHLIKQVHFNFVYAFSFSKPLAIGATVTYIMGNSVIIYSCYLYKMIQYRQHNS